MFRARKIVLLCISLVLFILMIIGISYITKDKKKLDLSSKDIEIIFLNNDNLLSLNNIQPISDELGINLNKYLDFKIIGNVDNKPIYYEINIVSDKDNTFDNKYLKIYLTDQYNQTINDIKYYNDLDNSINGKLLYQGVLSSKEETKEFRLRLWIDENYKSISSKKANYSINLSTKNSDI